MLKSNLNLHVRKEMNLGMRFWCLAVVPVVAVAMWSQDHSMSHIAKGDANWTALMKNMDTMHAAMADVEPSGNDDADFANMMLPHHQAAVDMARTELLHGSDPQMRRLAQEIIADQESEIQLMQLWLKTHTAGKKAPTQPQGSREPRDK